jgi:hypothetical protein
MAEQIVADALVEQAMRETGLDTFDSESFREGLGVFVSAFNKGIREGYHTDAGAARARSDSVFYLSNRLKVTDYLRQHPDAKRKIERPVFVMGIPRTGTTLLSNLLAADPARRSPLEWEIEEPVPPVASKADLLTDPRALARLEKHNAMLAANPEMGKIYRSSPIYPHECVWYLAHDFKTLMIESKGKLPEYKDFIFSADMTSAYSYHRKFLETLQHNTPGVWNLKMPSHALHLEYLIKEYPDARIIWTHRDPYACTASLCSIISMSHRLFIGAPDTEWLAEDYPWQAQQHAERAMDFRDAHGEDSLIDVHYDKLLSDPIGEMKKLYAALGDEWTPEAEAGIQGWLDDNPQGKFGKHEYKLAQYGLSKEKLVPLFDRYLSRYDVALEG